MTEATILTEEVDEVVTIEDLVGPDKKYATVDDLAKAYLNADKHIGNLKNDLDELRTELTKRVAVEEVLDKMTKSSQDGQGNRPPADDEAARIPAADISEDTVKSILNKELASLQKQDQRNANAKLVKDTLTATFGKNYLTSLKNRAEELGVSLEYIDELSKTQPQVAIALIGKPTKGEQIVPPSSSFDPSKRPTKGGVKNFKYFQELRRKDPARYWSASNRMEMNREQERQGDAFFQE